MSSVVENYIENVIKKSWTWERLTEAEKKRFLDMNVFELIRGHKKIQVQWLNSVYVAYLVALEYEPVGWRETESNVPRF